MQLLVAGDADAAPDEVPFSAQADPMLTPWACGFPDDSSVCTADRCADIVPELMVELI